MACQARRIAASRATLCVCSLLALATGCGSASARVDHRETSQRFVATDLPLPTDAVGTLALGATPDALVLALGGDLDAPADARPAAWLIAITPDGSMLTREAVDARGAPFVVAEERTLHVVWPGAADDAALATLARTFGTTRVVHERASLYFTLPYAALPLRVGDGATQFVLLHYDAVSCFVGGVNAAATVGSGDAARSFAVPGSFRPSLALAPVGDGFVAVYAPGDDGDGSAWRRIDHELQPVGDAHAVGTRGCGLAASTTAGVVAACDDEALVIDPGSGAARVVRYPTAGRALAIAAHAGETVVVVRVATGLELVRMPGGERLDAIETTLPGLSFDIAPRAALAAIDDARFALAWIEGDGRSAGQPRLRRYDLAQ